MVETGPPEIAGVGGEGGEGAEIGMSKTDLGGLGPVGNFDAGNS